MKTQPCQEEMELGYTSPLRCLRWAAWVVSSFFSPVGAQSCWCRFDDSLGVLKSGLAASKGRAEEQGSCGNGLTWTKYQCLVLSLHSASQHSALGKLYDLHLFYMAFDILLISLIFQRLPVVC